MTSDDAAEIIEPILIDSHATDRMATRGPRIRVTTRAERRRIWSVEQKREIVAESLAGGMSVSAVARKHDIYPGLLFTWRRQLLTGALGVVTPSRPRFARVDVVSTHRRDEPDRGVDRGYSVGGDAAVAKVNERKSGLMDIVLAGVTVQVDASVDQAALRRVLEALGHHR
jgi:transposase-like protein